jgi:acetyl-CoA synthetase
MQVAFARSEGGRVARGPKLRDVNSADFIWRPENHPWTRDSHVARFMRTRGLGSIAELRQASVHCYQWFWDEALRDMGLEWTQHYTHVRDNSRGFPWTRWFVAGEINVTHNCIDRHVRDGFGRETALFFESDSGRTEESRRVSFAELAALVDRCTLALRASGVQRGDSVGLYAPMGRKTLRLVKTSRQNSPRPDWWERFVSPTSFMAK